MTNSITKCKECDCSSNSKEEKIKYKYQIHIGILNLILDAVDLLLSVVQILSLGNLRTRWFLFIFRLEHIPPEYKEIKK